MSRVRGGQVFVEIGADPRRLFKALGDLNKHIGNIGSQLSGLGTRMSAFGAALAAPLALATRQFATFDDAIRATAAVSGASGTALQSLNDKARELGATTSFTAVQVANLMTELGRAGFRPDEIEAMTGAVLDLARATGTDATLSAGIMAATLRQFGLGATDAARAADVLTKAANSTFNTVEGLGESLKYAGPVAQSLGMSLEDTTAILGVLGNVGIQGSEAGTALRRLSVISAGAGAELQKIFGVKNTDPAGNLKPLVDILDEINQVTAGMPVAERTAKMADAFGLLGITSANVLSSSADGVKGLAEQLRNAQGTAAATAKEMDAGLGGAMRITLSAIEGAALAIGDALAPSLQYLVEGIGHAASTLTTFIKNNQEMVVSVAKGIATFTAIGAAMLTAGVAISATTASLGLLTNAFVLTPVAIMKSVVSLGLFAIASVQAGLTAVGSAVTIATAWSATALRGVAVFVGSALVGLASYMGAATAAVASSVVSAAAVAAAWSAPALRGVAVFVGSALAGLASYIGAATAAVASSVVSAAAVAAAWLAPLTPLLAIGAALAGLVAIGYSFGQQISNAFSGVGDMVNQAAGAIGSGFGQAVADAKIVLADMATTATTTFAGIYDAFAAGDLSLAMEIAWAGVQAVFARGAGAVMSYLDSWVAFFQNTFTYAGASIVTLWESMWSGIVQVLNVNKAIMMGVVDNIVNGIMAAFDAMVSSVRKSWNWVQSFIVKGYDLAKENAAVDSEMDARARQREASRPGITGRVSAALEENRKTAAETQSRIHGINQNANDIAQGRLDENERRRLERDEQAAALEGRVGELRQTAADRRVTAGQVSELDRSLGSVTSMEELQKLAATFRELRDSGKLSAEQLDRLETSLDAASERVMEAGMDDRATQQAAAAGAAAAQAQTSSSAADVVGTFSSAALGQLGFSQNLAQKQLDKLTAIEQNTRDPMAGLVAD